MHQLTLWNAQQGHSTLLQLWQWIKPHLIAGRRIQITAKEATRSSEQNAKLHAMINDIAKTREWAGKRRDIEVWKRLLTAAWLRARGESVELLPALDGHGIDVVFRPTSSLTVAECSELIDFVEAWEASNE